MIDNLIYGINPFTVSRISIVKARRFGVHPSYAKVMTKRNPIRGFLGLYEDGLFNGFRKANVIIYGSNGTALKYISCKSNQEAEQLLEELTQKLQRFLKEPR